MAERFQGAKTAGLVVASHGHNFECARWNPSNRLLPPVVDDPCMHVGCVIDTVEQTGRTEIRESEFFGKQWICTPVHPTTASGRQNLGGRGEAYLLK